MGQESNAVQKLCLFVYAIAISAYSNLKRLESNPSMIRLRLQAIKVITASSAHFVTWRERLSLRNVMVSDEKKMNETHNLEFSQISFFVFKWNSSNESEPKRALFVS